MVKCVPDFDLAVLETLGAKDVMGGVAVLGGLVLLEPVGVSSNACMEPKCCPHDFFA